MAIGVCGANQLTTSIWPRFVVISSIDCVEPRRTILLETAPCSWLAHASPGDFSTWRLHLEPRAADSHLCRQANATRRRFQPLRQRNLFAISSKPSTSPAIPRTCCFRFYTTVCGYCIQCKCFVLPTGSNPFRRFHRWLEISALRYPQSPWLVESSNVVGGLARTLR